MKSANKYIKEEFSQFYSNMNSILVITARTSNFYSFGRQLGTCAKKCCGANLQWNGVDHSQAYHLLAALKKITFL